MIDRIEPFLRMLAVLASSILALTMNAQASGEKILFDFQAATNPAVWQVVNDDVMGGVSTSRFEIVSNSAGVFCGVVSLENNGGFASVRSSTPGQDLSGCTGFLVRLRGDGHRYKFTVRTEDGFDTPLYQRGLVTKPGEWEEQRLAFKDFIPTFHGRTLTDAPPLNPAKVLSVGVLIADKQEGSFRLEIGWVKAVP